MKALEVIKFITDNPKFDTVVISDNDDMTPYEAVKYLLFETDRNEWEWDVDGNTLLVY